METTISPDFPFESKYISIKGSNMHYIDVGEGDPFLFLHGNPTSSYLWRNIIPHLQPLGRCIALDLIGMGKSDKPDIGYTYEDHYAYLEKFIEKLNLKNIILVVHDWGSGLGFNYANIHRGNIKGIAFMEALYKPMEWSDLPPDQRMAFKMMRTPFIGWIMISVANMFVKKMIPQMIVRKLTKKEFDYYKAPYPTIASRKPVRVWPMQIPLGGKPENVVEIVASYNKWLRETVVPKICFYAHPGAIIDEKGVHYIRDNFPNTKMVAIGKGLHYIQEDNPHRIGEEIAKWHHNI